MTAQPKQAEVKLRFTSAHQVANDFSNRRRELETMPGTGAHDQHLRMSRVTIDEEMAVGHVRVEANGLVDTWAEGGQKGPRQPSQRRGFVQLCFTNDSIGINGFALMVA